jgi:peptidoglycan hydrolase-like protein with peptidoglycan-binding domain
MNVRFSRVTLTWVCAASALASGCASVDHSVRAVPAKSGAAVAIGPPAPTTVASATTSSTLAVTTTPRPTTTTAPATTTTTVAPTTTLPPTTTTTLPPTTTIAKIPALTAPLTPLRGGAVGEEVKALQNRLLDLGFWLDAADGEYGWLTSQAVMAFQKTYGGVFELKPTGNADEKTEAAMTLIDTRAQGTITTGDLIEVDKGRQVLFIIRGGKTLWVFNTSTGSEKPYTEVNQKQGGTIQGDAVTPEGNFKVYSEYTNGWEKGQLGELYRPKYFKGGVAVHGSNSIPEYPASHGCVRLTTTAMDWIWTNDMMPQGTQVIVHP